MDPATTTVLSTHNLSIGYAPPRRPATVVAQELEVSLLAGEFVCLIGPNGAGKSTLIRTLAGMQAPLSGEVRLMGDTIHELPPQVLAKQLSVVLTERINVGNLSVQALVGLGRYPYTDWAGRLTPHDEQVVAWALEAVSATPLARRNVSELSDGERQKVMVARALAQEPQLMILDEPTAFLDVPRRVEIIGLLRELARTTQRAILLSTHDLDLALRSADRIWLLPMDGDLQVGAPEDLVLNGGFERVFQSEGVTFNIETGAFSLASPTWGEATLVGGENGPVTFWTTRALERAGFQVVETPAKAAVQVEIVLEDNQTRWRSTTTDLPQEHTSIEALIRFLTDAQLSGNPKHAYDIAHGRL